VLNVILSATGGIDGNVTMSARRLYTGRVVPDISGSALIRKAPSTINLSAGTSNVLNLEEGTDTLTDPETGDLIEHRRKHNSYRDFNPYVSASWALERASDKAIRLNGRWSPGSFYLTQTNHVKPTGDLERDDDLLQDFKSPVYESSAATSPGRWPAERSSWSAWRRGASATVAGALSLPERRRHRYSRRVRTAAGCAAQRDHPPPKLDQVEPRGFSVETGSSERSTRLTSRSAIRASPRRRSRPIDLPVDQANVKEKRAEAFDSGRPPAVQQAPPRCRHQL
jgi:hypothetical protein